VYITPSGFFYFLQLHFDPRLQLNIIEGKS
jgi:hypothetical protein